MKKLSNYTFDTYDVTCNLRRWNNESIDIYKNEVWNARFTKSSYKTELCKMTSHFESLTQNFYIDSSFELLTLVHEKLNETSSY